MGKNTFYQNLLWILLLTVLPLSGCGKENGSHEFGIDGYVYIPQQVGLQGMPLDNFQIREGYIYYRSGDYSGGTDLCRFPVEDLFSREMPELPAGKSLFAAGSHPGYIIDYTIDEDGWLYYLEFRQNVREAPVLSLSDGVEGAAMEDAEISYVLVKQQPGGKEEYCVSLADEIRSVACDGQEGVYALSEELIYFIDGNGRIQERIPLEDGSGELLEGKDGSVYYDRQDSGNVIFEITSDGALKRLEGPYAGGGSFAGSREGLLYSGNNGMLYRYDKDNSSWEALLRWGDSNLSVRQNWELLWISEDRIVVCFPAPEQTDVLMKECYILVRTPVDELPEKEILVMASCNLYERLEQYIMAFNRSSEKYHITIEHYDMERLDAALVSSDPPDLINLTDMDYTKYGRKDVLEDLMPYLEESSLLDKEDFMEAILKACTVKGRLVCISDEIQCTTVIGRTFQVGADAGWTAADVMALATANPQAKIFLHNNFPIMIRELFQDYILGQYVDWERGECSFDGEEFLTFIRWVAEYSDVSDDEEVPMEALWGTMPDDRLLSIWAHIISLEDLMYERAYFGEPVTAVGYPTSDGSVSHHGTAINHLGIVTASNRKEGAWQFIESFLSREDGAYTFLPARKDRLDELAETMLADENEEGKTNERKIHIQIPDGAEEYYAGMAREDLDAVFAIIEAADYTPRQGTKAQIIDIIVEEMSPCLTGAKSYEEAAAIVQNRVSMVVQEEF